MIRHKIEMFSFNEDSTIHRHTDPPLHPHPHPDLHPDPHPDPHPHPLVTPSVAIDFIAEHYILTTVETDRIPRSVINGQFRAWCQEVRNIDKVRGKPKLSAELKAELENAGFKIGTSTKRVKGYKDPTPAYSYIVARDLSPQAATS